MLLASDAGAGQLSAKVATVGVLLLNPAAPTIFDAFRRGLQGLGYIEGQTLTLEVRHAEGQEAALPQSGGRSGSTPRWTSFSRQEMQPCVPPKTRPARFPS